MKRTAFGVAVALFMSVSGLLWAAETPMAASASFPASVGNVSYQHDRNRNTSFTVHAKHLASPDSLTPAKSVYVVWTQPRGKDPQNQGTLSVNENLEGTLNGTVPAQIFDIFVTAEDSANVQGPSGPEVLRTTIQHH